MKYFYQLIVFILIVSCSGITMISPGSEDLYSKEFMARVEIYKKQFGDGQKELALKNLKAMKEEGMQPSEKALRRNLMGVIHFSSEEYEQAIYQFNLALLSSSLDRKLTAQIHLNLASSYFKLGSSEKSLETLNKTEYRNLMGGESKKFHLLRLTLAKELAQSEAALDSAIWLLKDHGDLMSLKGNKYYGDLVNQYFSLDESKRMRIVQKYSEDKFFVAGYLSYLETQHLITLGRNEEATSLVEWIKDNFEENQEILNILSVFKEEFKDVSMVNQATIGVVLPLSGKKKDFGTRALTGIDFALRKIKEKSGVEIKLLVRDSKGSAVLGKKIIRELIEKNKVSVIIGGLFSTEALSEYEEARKYRTLFISLSQVYIEKSLKDHLLLEVPGSVESQLSLLFSDDFLNYFGKDSAIIFPDSERGRAYLEEYWQLAQQKDVKVRTVSSYDKNKTDQTDTIKKVLGLKFKRERQEELELLQEVHKLEGRTSIRRIQTLKPEVDFDWVFIPAFPNEAMQIIPSFGYYDAFNIPIIGGPSWRSRALSRQSRKHGKLYFIDSKIPSSSSEFMTDYTNLYGAAPSLIEILGYDGMTLASEVGKLGQFEQRSELDKALAENEFLNGATGTYSKSGRLWLKNMNVMTLYRGNAKRLDMTVVENDEEKTEVQN